MASNGNDPRLEQLENTLRGALQAGASGPPVDAETPYDLAARVSDAAKALRDVADYTNRVAAELERTMAAYIANMNRLLGKIGK